MMYRSQVTWQHNRFDAAANPLRARLATGARSRGLAQKGKPAILWVVADSRHQPTVRPQRLALGVLTRVPVAGAVKRHLSPPLSPQRAAELSAALLADLLGVLTLLPMGYRALLCDSEAARDTLKNNLPPRWQAAAINETALDRQIAKGLDHLYATGVEAAGIVTSDSPFVSLDEIYEGLMWLTKRRGLLLGPTTTGSLYFVAMSHAEPALFDGVDWTSPGVVKRLEQRAKDLKIETQTLSQVAEVETKDELIRFVKDVRSGTNKPIGGLPACTALLNAPDFAKLG
ncbi:MAG TPA: hypothetical protein PK156_14980 [Polyangium sp.]|nr:hypothetical protein [Polyangium sp.]